MYKLYSYFFSTMDKIVGLAPPHVMRCVAPQMWPNFRPRSALERADMGLWTGAARPKMEPWSEAMIIHCYFNILPSIGNRFWRIKSVKRQNPLKRVKKQSVWSTSYRVSLLEHIRHMLAHSNGKWTIRAMHRQSQANLANIRQKQVLSGHMTTQKQ